MRDNKKQTLVIRANLLHYLDAAAYSYLSLLYYIYYYICNLNLNLIILYI